MRKILAETQILADAQLTIENYHVDIVNEVNTAINKHEWVIVGMKHNPYVKTSRKYLETKNIMFHYIVYGSYYSKWKIRLAVKLWSGWPTFPQVFHKGKLVGGSSELIKYLS